MTQAEYGQVVCKQCGAKSRVWIGSLAYTRQRCPEHLGSPTSLLREVMQTKYFGVQGTLEGDYMPGLYVIEAPNIETARTLLHSKTLRLGRGEYRQDQLQEITGEWAKVLSDTIDAIRNREPNYYVNLGSGVYYVEI